jgi:hypothetical protein
MISRGAEAFTGARSEATRFVVRNPHEAAELMVLVRVVGPYILGLPVRETRRDDVGRDVPGVGGFAHPASIPEAVSASYRNNPGCRSDPFVAAMLGTASRRVAGPANERIAVFFPVPSALRPAIETSARPQAPSSEPDNKNNAALDKPKDQRGVSIKEEKEAVKAQEKQLERDNALSPENRVAPPETADARTTVLYERYVDVRTDMERASFTLQERGSDAGPVLTRNEQTGRDPANRALEQKLVDQTLRLDSASREFFSKPGWQREAGFQRALVLSMYATGLPLEQALKELGAMFSGRGVVDIEQLSKLANAYGLNELNTTLSETLRVPPELVAQRDAERLAQMQKLKGGRLPEEMLLQQQQAREATGKKSKRGTADDRIDSVDRDPRGGHQQQQEQEEAEELIADDEATNPGFVLKL